MSLSTPEALVEGPFDLNPNSDKWVPERRRDLIALASNINKWYEFKALPLFNCLPEPVEDLIESKLGYSAYEWIAQAVKRSIADGHYVDLGYTADSIRHNNGNTDDNPDLIIDSRNINNYREYANFSAVWNSLISNGYFEVRRAKEANGLLFVPTNFLKTTIEKRLVRFGYLEPREGLFTSDPRAQINAELAGITEGIMNIDVSHVFESLRTSLESASLLRYLGEYNAYNGEWVNTDISNIDASKALSTENTTGDNKDTKLILKSLAKGYAELLIEGVLELRVINNQKFLTVSETGARIIKEGFQIFSERRLDNVTRQEALAKTIMSAR